MTTSMDSRTFEWFATIQMARCDFTLSSNSISMNCVCLLIQYISLIIRGQVRMISMSWDTFVSVQHR